MGEPSDEAFANWLHPSDVVEGYYQQGRGNDEAEALTLAMLCDGLLQAAAGQFIVNGKDLGLALIPRDIWPFAGKTDVWSTGRFRFAQPSGTDKPWSISAYDVRIDPEIRELPAPPQPIIATPTQIVGKPPLSEARLTEWARLFLAAHPDATESTARKSLKVVFPENSVTRDRIRAVLPRRRVGRPQKSKG